MAGSLITAGFAALAILVNGHPVENNELIRRLGVPSRIVGGDTAPEAYAPYMAALVCGESVKSLICGSSIISKRHILTAAHCIDPVVVNDVLISSFHAVIGSNLWNSTKHIAKFSNFLNHPSWDSQRIKNDVGVLNLTKELELNDRVAVVTLSFDWINGGVRSSVTGWGRLGVTTTGHIVIMYPYSDELQLLYLETMSPQQCAAALDKAATTWNSSLVLDSELEMCTLHSVGHGLCYGDSGSPLISRETGHQIGIASWAHPCARGVPDVFARINSSKDSLLPILRS
ncbi:unnamed protein product [Parnassius mnemosyne]|uniref:Peptidase S1 domain-containing protein n=1 Tax=Parnassius mnemosyne TaxID=213953 RepID=A0AAV1KKX7_9NEOP